MPASEQMEVDMENGLSGIGSRIRHDAISRLRNTLVTRDLDARLHHPAQETGISFGKIRHRRDMPTWDHENMHRSLRIDVLERDKLVILIHGFGGNAPRDNSAEKTIAHWLLPDGG